MLHALLTLSKAFVDRGGGAIFAAAGLMSALGQLCMVLPTTVSTPPDDTHSGGVSGQSKELRLVLRLMSEQMRLATPGHENANSAAATHHAVSALLRDTEAPGGGDAELQLELLNFLNLALVLHDEALHTLVANAVLVTAVARLAADGRVSHGGKADNNAQLAAAACLLLAQLLRRSAREKTSLAEQLRGRIA